MKSTKNKLLTVGLLAAVFICLSLTQGAAYTTIGSWLDSNIPPEMSVNQNGTNDCSGELRALYRAGMTWGNVSGSYFYFDRRVPTFNNEHVGYDDGYHQIS